MGSYPAGKGPLVYFDFLKEHGIGYHHILREIPEKQWESTLQDYERAGVELSCQGKVGPVSWCYMNTKDKLGFFMELRTDSAMTNCLMAICNIFTRNRPGTEPGYIVTASRRRTNMSKFDIYLNTEKPAVVEKLIDVYPLPVCAAIPRWWHGWDGRTLPTL